MVGKRYFIYIHHIGSRALNIIVTPINRGEKPIQPLQLRFESERNSSLARTNSIEFPILCFSLLTKCLLRSCLVARYGAECVLTLHMYSNV